jgi:YD repeat-containing protein
MKTATQLLFLTFFVSLAIDAVALNDKEKLFACVVRDPKNGNLSVRHSDFKSTDLTITRTYNSIVSFKGMFGERWCSDFESTVEIFPEGNIIFRQCGAGRASYYGTRAGIDSAVLKFVDELILKNTHVESRDEKNALKSRLLSDPAFRKSYAAKLGINNKLSDGIKLYEGGRGPSYMRVIGGKLHLVHSNSTTYVFNEDGRIAEVLRSNSAPQVYEYRNKLLIGIREGKTYDINFRYNAQNLVDQATMRNQRISYQYVDSRLSDVIGGIKPLKYTYEVGANLTAFDGDEYGVVIAKLDDQSGRVRRLHFANSGCTQEFSYPQTNPVPDNYAIEMRVNCKGSPERIVHYSYWTGYNKAKTRRTLFRSTVDGEGEPLRVEYDPAFEQPVQLREGTKKTQLTLDPWGRVRSVMVGKDERIAYEYSDECGTLSSIEKGGTKRFFYYNAQCRLVNVQEGKQSIRLSYDSKGLVSSASDNTGKALLIRYEAKFGKPNLIEVPSMGEIRVTYKANGEIDKVISEQGPAVASKVAGMLSEVLTLADTPNPESHFREKSELRKTCECSPDALLPETQGWVLR